jgi:hypothetical protein
MVGSLPADYLRWYKSLSVRILSDVINYVNGGKPTVLAVRGKSVVFGPQNYFFWQKSKKISGENMIFSGLSQKTAISARILLN